MVRIELDKIKANALHMLDKMLQLEHYPVFTQNGDLASEKKKWLLFYTRIRREPSRYLIDQAHPSHESSESEGADSDAEDIAEDAEDIQEALSVMANVRAYFQVIYKVDSS